MSRDRLGESIAPPTGPMIIRVTGWTAVVAAMLAWFTLAAMELAADFDLDMYFDPARALGMSRAAQRWFRLALLTDSVGFYLSFLIVGGYLHARLRRRDAVLAELATLSLIVYVLLGIVGALTQFAVLGPLITAYESADAATRTASETAWQTVVFGAQRGLWWFECPAMTIWASIVGTYLSRARFGSGRLLIVVGLAYGAYFLAELTGINSLASLTESAAVGVLPLWLLVFGLGILRGRTGEPGSRGRSLRAPFFHAVTRFVIGPIFTAGIAPARKRARLNRVAQLNRLHSRLGIRREHTKLGGVPVEWVRFREHRDDACLLYFHGGGYLTGSPLTHRALTAALAKTCRIPVAVIDYRLAPEYPFPAAPTDAINTYMALLADGLAPERIILAGDSAGAALALACALQARDTGLPLPAGLICLSPWTDLSLSGASVQRNRSTEITFTSEVLAAAAGHYLAGANVCDPLASPVFADLTGLPPMLIQVTDTEILQDDAMALAAAARAHGVDVDLDVAAGLWHVWHSYAGQLPEADDAIESIADFTAKVLRHNTISEVTHPSRNGGAR